MTRVFFVDAPRFVAKDAFHSRCVNRSPWKNFVLKFYEKGFKYPWDHTSKMNLILNYDSYHGKEHLSSMKIFRDLSQKGRPQKKPVHENNQIQSRL